MCFLMEALTRFVTLKKMTSNVNTKVLLTRKTLLYTDWEKGIRREGIKLSLYFPSLLPEIFFLFLNGSLLNTLTLHMGIKVGREEEKNVIAKVWI